MKNQTNGHVFEQQLDLFRTGKCFFFFFLPHLAKGRLFEGDLFPVRISSLTESMSCPSVRVNSLTVSVSRYFLLLFLALMNVVLVFFQRPVKFICYFLILECRVNPISIRQQAWVSLLEHYHTSLYNFF